MIRVDSLQKSFGKRLVLADLSFEIKPGRVTGILGPNACGKTTLIKSLLGLTVPQSGRAWAESLPILGTANSEDASRFREKTGYMPQYPDFPANLSVRELLRMIEDLRQAKAPRMREHIAYFRLEEAMTQPFGQLSGGTKQKVAATLAFMFDAPLIVLDEPTAGLDPVASVRFKDLVKSEASRGKTILLVSHVLPEVEQLVDDILFLIDGRIAFSGSIDELRARTEEPTLERAITRLVTGRPRELVP
jgi:Cu-processing system ATP-binding protein